MRILLCGLGNRERGDDGFGPYVVSHIQQKDHIKTMDCALNVENYLNLIVDSMPDLVIFFDTVQHARQKPVLLRDKEMLDNVSISLSTHNLPLSALYDYLKESCNAAVWLYGVPVHSYEQLTRETIKRAERVIAIFNSLDSKNKINIIDLYETLSTTLT
jgi:hydrogenase maturation protease